MMVIVRWGLVYWAGGDYCGAEKGFWRHVGRLLGDQSPARCNRWEGAGGVWFGGHYDAKRRGRMWRLGWADSCAVRDMRRPWKAIPAEWAKVRTLLGIS